MDKEPIINPYCDYRKTDDEITRKLLAESIKPVVLGDSIGTISLEIYFLLLDMAEWKGKQIVEWLKDNQDNYVHLGGDGGGSARVEMGRMFDDLQKWLEEQNNG